MHKDGKHYQYYEYGKKPDKYWSQTGLLECDDRVKVISNAKKFRDEVKEIEGIDIEENGVINLNYFPVLSNRKRRWPGEGEYSFNMYFVSTTLGRVSIDYTWPSRRSIKFMSFKLNNKKARLIEAFKKSLDKIIPNTKKDDYEIKSYTTHGENTVVITFDDDFYNQYFKDKDNDYSGYLIDTTDHQVFDKFIIDAINNIENYVVEEWLRN